jgi:hypothetical protein
VALLAPSLPPAIRFCNYSVKASPAGVERDIWSPLNVEETQEKAPIRYVLRPFEMSGRARVFLGMAPGLALGRH